MKRLALVMACLLIVHPITWLPAAEIACVQYPLYDTGVNCLYCADYYLDNEQSNCDNDTPQIVYHWANSGTPSPENCPNCCPAFCLPMAVDASASPQENAPEPAKAGPLTLQCNSLTEPIDPGFKFKRDNGEPSVFGTKPTGGGMQPGSRWLANDYITVTPRWIKLQISEEKTIPVKLFQITPDLKRINAEKLKAARATEFKTRPEPPIYRIGFETKLVDDSLPAGASNAVTVKPTWLPAPYDGACKTMCLVTLADEDDAEYVVTTSTPLR